MFNIDKRILYVIIAIFALFTIAQYIQNPMELVALLLTLPGVIVAITFHEFAHAFVADKLGDDTPRRQGRLNLNPLSHIDPVGFFMLIFVHFGWGKPVEINPTNFNRKRSDVIGEDEKLIKDIRQERVVARSLEGVKAREYHNNLAFEFIEKHPQFAPIIKEIKYIDI